MIRRFKAKSAAAALSTDQSPIVAAVGSAIRETLERQFTEQERELLLAIERRRASLCRSDQAIATMKNGKPTQTPLSKIATASKHEFWSILLFKLVRKLAPVSCVELGTNVGISAAYQATALELNNKGTLVTLEGSEDRAKIAQETLSQLGLNRASIVVGRFQETLAGVLEAAKPVDYLFNDGHHDRDAVLEYFELALPFLADNAAVIIDDVSWSAGMREAWAKLERDERVSFAIDLDTIGIIFLARGDAPRLQIRMPL